MKITSRERWGHRGWAAVLGLLVALLLPVTAHADTPRLIALPATVSPSGYLPLNDLDPLSVQTASGAGVYNALTNKTTVLPFPPDTDSDVAQGWGTATLSGPRAAG